MRYTYEQLNMLEPVEIYNLVLNGDTRRFPPGFWQKPDSNVNSVKIIKYLLEDILKFTDKEIKDKFTINLLREYKLGTLAREVYNCSTYAIINDAYPNRFKPWEFRQTHRNYWNKENCVKVTKWLIEEKLKWTDEDILKNNNVKVFVKNGLSCMLKARYNNSYFNAIEEAYPNRFKPWEFRKAPNNFWNKERAKEAVKWLIEDKLKWNDEQIKRHLTNDTFTDNGLVVVIQKYYNYSTFKAINDIYPNRFKPWELRSVNQNYWTLDTAREATKWMIEKKLKWSKGEVISKLTYNTFKDCGMLGMLHKLFNSSPYLAIENAYPNKFDRKGFIKSGVKWR